jgi:hypothetical protein
MRKTPKDTTRHTPAIIGGMPLMINAPYMTQEKWAEWTGESLEAVRLQLNRGKLTEYRKQGCRKVYINVLAEFKKTLEAEIY